MEVQEEIQTIALGERGEMDPATERERECGKDSISWVVMYSDAGGCALAVTDEPGGSHLLRSLSHSAPS